MNFDLFEESMSISKRVNIEEEMGWGIMGGSSDDADPDDTFDWT